MKHNPWDYYDLAREIASKHLGLKRTHVSLILRKGKVFSGVNEPKSHTLSSELGAYPWHSCGMHSEVAALLELRRSVKNPYDKKLVLLNFRFSPTGCLGMAKPCKYCLPWCVSVFDEIWYSLDPSTIHKYNGE